MTNGAGARGASCKHIDMNRALNHLMHAVLARSCAGNYATKRDKMESMHGIPARHSLFVSNRT